MSKAEELVKATQEMPELESQATSDSGARAPDQCPGENLVPIRAFQLEGTILGLILGSVPEKQVSGWRTLASVTTKGPSAHSESL